MVLTMYVRIKSILLLFTAAIFLLQVGCSGSKTVNQNEVAGQEYINGSTAGPPQVNFETFRDQGKLAFIWDGRLYVLNGDSGTLDKLSEPGKASKLKWSADGQWLAYVNGDNQLQITRTDGTEFYEVAGLKESMYNAPDFAWSPAANVLAVVPDVKKRDIYLIQPGETPLQLTDVYTGASSFCWALDGKTIAYVDTLPYDPNDPVNRVDVLHKIPAEGGEAARLYTAEGAAIRLAGWQPDKKEVLFWLSPGHSASAMADGLKLYTVPLTGGKSQAIATTLVYPEWLTWSKDGTKLLAVAGSGREIWKNKSLSLFTPQTGSCVNLPQRTDTVRLYPDWSNKGDMFCFLEAPDLSNGNGENSISNWRQARALGIANADGTGARPLDEAGTGLGRPLWSRDGEHILYLKDSIVWLIDISGGTPVRIVGPFPGENKYGYYGLISWGDEIAYFRD
ncbi:MAG: hypothetical protein FH756_20585 [Firmicutes bacterium]|nr:hypothetical protein [Bacillota bacterium]